MPRSLKSNLQKQTLLPQGLVVHYEIRNRRKRRLITTQSDPESVGASDRGQPSAGREQIACNQFEGPSRINALATDFIDIEILAQAVASNVKLETSISKRVFNLDEAAAYCGLTRDSFEKQVVRDRIQKVRLDKCWRFDKADLDAWIDGHKDEITGEAA